MLVATGCLFRERVEDSDFRLWPAPGCGRYFRTCPLFLFFYSTSNRPRQQTSSLRLASTIYVQADRQSTSKRIGFCDRNRSKQAVGSVLVRQVTIQRAELIMNWAAQHLHREDYRFVKIGQLQWAILVALRAYPLLRPTPSPRPTNLDPSINHCERVTCMAFPSVLQQWAAFES